jgi:hypothetical protein
MRQICGTLLPTKNETTTEVILYYKVLFSLTIEKDEMSILLYFMGFIRVAIIMPKLKEMNNVEMKKTEYCRKKLKI